MKVLFDTNVVLDVLLKRPGWSESALAISLAPESWISALSVANITCIIDRSKTARVLKPLAYLTKKFSVASLGLSTIQRAIELNFEDFEDAIQAASCEENSIEILVTRNLKDFRPGENLAILSVPDLIARFAGQSC